MSIFEIILLDRIEVDKIYLYLSLLKIQIIEFWESIWLYKRNKIMSNIISIN